MEITEGEQNRMLVRWKSPKCQTAYRLLSPCNLNSQHQSDKLFDRPRVTDACTDNNGFLKKKKKHINKTLIRLTMTRQKKGDENVLRGAGAEHRVQAAQQYPSVLNLLKWFVSWLCDWARATSSFGGSAEVTAQTLFIALGRFSFSPSPPSLPETALAPTVLSPP